jgi:hypothetical protein
MLPRAAGSFSGHCSPTVLALDPPDRPVEIALEHPVLHEMVASRL